MRKVKLHIAMSLNGKIALDDGSVDWLEGISNPEKTDYGYDEFYKSIDTTIQGYKTYELFLSKGIDFPYTGKKNYVFTTKVGLENTEHVEFIKKNHVNFVKDLKQGEGGDIWVVGGGYINAMFLNEDLIDEIQLFVMPIVLSEGINLFASLPNETKLKLIESKTYSSGAVELRYQLAK